MKARRIAIFATAIAVGAGTLGSLPAGATGSATAGDTKTREVGSALAGKVSISGTNGGFAWNLSQKPASVEVIVRAGTTVAYCMRFTGGDYSVNQIFQSRYAPAPVSCA